MCATPLIGEVEAGDLCDSCRSSPRLWGRARAAMLYDGNAKSIVLRLKHADRMDLARPVGKWLAEAARPLVEPNTIVAPVPLHWFRGLRRRYNQSILLSRRVSNLLDIDHCPDMLQRRLATRKLDGMNAKERSAVVSGAITLRARCRQKIEGRPVLLIDDVMTTGATLTECTKACLAGGASQVSVAVLARVAKRN
ncbi:comF family protein [Pacificibacter marinus]|uniref:DNA utilization protein GntX n=2 Tax=Pacificibacter marinus TaxID=658057 RepID=A0A1Y5SZ45_9RHOB|nr:comF family protein [Pacificibacter marinus]SLN52288.1 DNA utilization protein GntX [Pacificibacter marinus]